MPLVPILDVGLTPTIQLGLLGYLAYWTVVKKRKLAVSLLLLFVVLLMPFIIVRVPQESIVSLSEATPTDVAIIFGAGLKRDGTPSDALMDRLRVAAELYRLGKVKRILVSGDNRFEEYSEPGAMKTALIDVLNVPSDIIRVDYAGRRTYDTCMRAHKLWGIDSAILVSQDFHLPRAIWTCRRLGIESAGVSASLQPYIFDSWYGMREWIARYKAFIDVFLWRPEYVDGPFIENLDADVPKNPEPSVNDRSNLMPV